MMDIASSGEESSPGLATEARQLLEIRTDPALVEQVAAQLVSSLGDGEDPSAGLSDDEFRQLLRLLILDESSNDPPALHTRIANYHSGGVQTILSAAGALLGDALIELLSEGIETANVVLMFLLLRHHIGGAVSEEVVSSLHLRLFASFSTGDLTLPYSNAFTREFDQNCNDLDAYALAGTGAAGELPLVHQLLVEWVTARRVTEGADEILRRLSAGSPNGATAAEEETAAAKSLMVRRLGSSGPPTVAQIETLGGPGFVELCNSIVERRKTMPAHGTGAQKPGTRMADRRLQGARGARAIVAQRLGMPSSRRPRVALCVSGQLRGYRHTLTTWQSSLLRIADCDVFVHTWANVGRSSAEGFRSSLPFEGTTFCDAYREVALRQGFDAVKARYPRLFAELALGGRVTSEELARCYRTDFVVVDDDEQAPFHGWTNQQKMHTKIERAFDLATATGRDYDLVVRIRPDKPIAFTAFSWSEVLAVCAGSPTILADTAFGTHYAKAVIGDQFAMGSPEVMATYSRTASIYPAIAAAGLHECPTELAGHSSLAQVCWLHGIDVRRAPIKFGPLCEASPMGSEQIRHQLRLDSSGRTDDDDRHLLRAVEADLRG